MMEDLVTNAASKRRRTSATVKGKDPRRTVRLPLVLQGVEPGKLTTIPVSKFGDVDVDRRYQRDRIGSEINDLIYVLQHGGEIPDPITVVRRNYVEGSATSPSDKLWIIDGQQRFWAHLECGVPVKAMVHGVDSLDAERDFFLAMNTDRSVNANAYVYSWKGPSAELLRRADSIPSHPLYGRIQFRGSGAEKIGARVLISGMVSLLYGNPASGATPLQLNRVDARMKDPGMTSRCEAFISVVGRVFPQGYATVLAVQALGIVARDRWAKRIETPSEATLLRLSKINWKNEVPGYSAKFLPVLQSLISRVWR